jgi:hypothetical protein
MIVLSLSIVGRKMAAETANPGIGLHVAAIVVFMLVLGIYLYRNLVFRDTLYVIRGQGSAPTSALRIHADQLLAVHLQPAPRFPSMAFSLAQQGFGGEKLMLQTPRGLIPYGCGMRDADIPAFIAELEAFCGRQLLKK